MNHNTLLSRKLFSLFLLLLNIVWKTTEEIIEFRVSQKSWLPFISDHYLTDSVKSRCRGAYLIYGSAFVRKALPSIAHVPLSTAPVISNSLVCTCPCS